MISPKPKARASSPTTKTTPAPPAPAARRKPPSPPGGTPENFFAQFRNTSHRVAPPRAASSRIAMRRIATQSKVIREFFMNDNTPLVHFEWTFVTSFDDTTIEVCNVTGMLRFSKVRENRRNSGIERQSILLSKREAKFMAEFFLNSQEFQAWCRHET